MAYILLFLFVMGMVWGSFLNVVVWRLSHGGSPLSGRSKCPKCKHMIPWYMNIPVLSYLFLNGKCAFCKKPISMMYPLMELMVGVFFVWWFVVGFNFFKLVGNPWSIIQPLFWLLVGLTMLVIFVIDLLYMIIPLPLNLFLLTLALMYRIGLTGFGVMQWEDFSRSVLSGLALFVFFGGLQILTKKFRGVDGFGLGDIFLVPSLGLLLGWPKVVPGVFLAFILGSLVGVFLLVFRKRRANQYLPFGPFLIAGASIALMFGNQIWQWYLSLLV